MILMLAMTTDGRTPSPTIARSAIPPTVDLSGLVSAGIVVVDDQTATMPHLRKLAEGREKTRDRVAKFRERKRATPALQERDTSATPPSPLSPPHTPPLTPLPLAEGSKTRAREGWAAEIYAAADSMLGRRTTGSEGYRIEAKLVELESMPDFTCDGKLSKAGEVFAACCRYTTDKKGVRGGIIPWINYAASVFDGCQRTGLGPGKMARAKPGGVEFVTPEDTGLEDRIKARFEKRGLA